MIETDARKEILSAGKPDPPFRGEPLLGGYYTEEEVDTVVATVRESMDWHVGFGFITKEITDFEDAFADFCGTEFAISINGAGTGLDMAMMALDLEPGDEVIVPAINFRAAPLSVVGQGGQIIWCEVDPRTLQADPSDVESRITPRTRAIYPVHMNGLSAPMDDLLDIADRNPHPVHGPLKVIGDAARACGGKYRDSRIGKKGWMTVFSFHTQKLMTTLGEGGAITTDDPDLARRLRGFRQFGAETGEWGTNYKITKVQAAVGLVQIRRLDEMLAKRARRARQRTLMLGDIPELTLPYEPTDCVHTYYLYTCLVPKDWAGEKRNRMLQILDDDYGVGCIVANPPAYEYAHRDENAVRDGRRNRSILRETTAGQTLPLSDELGARLFCISIHPLMTEAQNEYICAAVIEAVERMKAG